MSGGGGIQVEAAKTAAQHSLFVELIGGSDARLQVVLVVLPGGAGISIHIQEPESPAYLGDLGERRSVDPLRDRVEGGRIEGVILTIESLLERGSEVPPA